MTSPLEQLPNTYRAFFSGFSRLTEAQNQLIHPILHGEDIILQASTGAGKTEAVLAPATERLMIHPGHFTILYIVPTRALALDMNRRIKPIYKKLGLKSGIRTGDGKQLRDATPHCLIMTPESLDVLLGSQNQDNKHFLKHVQIIIIDEVHVFLHNDRGYQLSYLRRRLGIQCIGMLQTVVLSATIDNADDVIRFFNLNTQPFYYKQSVPRKLQPSWVHIKDEEQELTLLFDDLYYRSACKKLLVFANSRKKCEQLYDILNQEGVFCQKVFLHYSNLSTQERKFIETSFREEKTGVCIATNTLELGIDIGDIDGVVLMGPPPSTVAFLQKIGRSNRRQQHINFWGICYGQKAGIQLIRFLAFFELAQEHQLEQTLNLENYSVLFQQILSCLYAKKALSIDSLHQLFKEKSEELSCIFHHMLDNNWLKSTKQTGIYDGGWRYFSSLKKKQIWSNFPPADEEYDVILEHEKIATLPLSMVRQLEVGDHFQLTGKVLRVLQIEEKKAALELWVETSNELASKELIWMGHGSPIPFEVAQKMGAILLNQHIPQGLLNRTRRLLEKEREQIARSVEQPHGIRVHQLKNGMYRYETFLGSIANYILCQLIEKQFGSQIEGLLVDCDETGLECNEWLPFNDLKIPHTMEQFQEWIALCLPLLKGRFAWNNWMYGLPEKYQQKEISSRLHDSRVLEHFQSYCSESIWLPLPENVDHDEKTVTHFIPLKGKPWSLEDEKNSWGMLSFAKLPIDASTPFFRLTATQVQSYVTQNLCPRWARFQHLNYQIESHPRFNEMTQENQSRRNQGIRFKKEVFDALQNQANLCFETPELTWQQAIKSVISNKKPLFLAQARLNVDRSLYGSPDLIYIQHQGEHICLEVWDIKFSRIVNYAQKWRVAFYAHLLDSLLNKETFLLPIRLSNLGGIIHPSIHHDKLFEKAPFTLAPYTLWMPRLINQWKTDSMSRESAENYSMEFSCTSCCYFSYCYQEKLFTDLTALEPQIVSQNIESNDFPRNCRQWYFLHYDTSYLQWQCWENGVSINDGCIRLQDFPNEESFQSEIANQLNKQWTQSIIHGKNPHLLVYESTDWYRFKKTVQLTVLKSLWAVHVPWTSMQTVLQTHFIWPFHGKITATQVGSCLGLSNGPIQPPSFYHRDAFKESPFDLYRQIWNWCLSKVTSQRALSFENNKMHSVPLMYAYLAIQHREAEYRMSEISEFQKKTLPDRVKQFRAIGPIRFLGTASKKEDLQFSIAEGSTVSKFRVGDFLKLSPVDKGKIQDGFSVILDTYSPEDGTLSIRPLSQKINLRNNQQYALDEDATDWNAPKIIKILNLLKDPTFCPEVIQLLLGHTKNFASDTTAWVEEWYQSIASIAGLNHLQKQALILPFREKIGLIEGPPGTGKTHLLVWTLIALVAQSLALKRSLKILVTAQTHHAIDQILKKVAKTLPAVNCSSVSLWKYGRFDETAFSTLKIGQMQDYDELHQHSCLILGATGYGVYQLLANKNVPKVFDWIVFDESSQILTSYALLSLIFGKGQALFYGDTQQLPPILKGNYENSSFIPRSILQELRARYGTQNCLRLSETYRMNSQICQFASEQWYNGELKSVVAKKDQKLELPAYPLFQDFVDDYLNPSKPMVLVQLDHSGCQQSSSEEVALIAKMVRRLIHDYSISSEQIGIISPHRLQNNRILSALKETLPFSLTRPRVDTVERMQGCEFDIVMFSATVSDKTMLHSSFLKDYRRFNVALTRARKKFIFVASSLFFQSFPTTEQELTAQMPFEYFFAHNHSD